MKCWVTGESFGADLPENWEMITEFLNSIIGERGIEDDQNAVNDLWDDFWAGKVMWYAVRSGSDDDWGDGSYVLERAKRMAQKLRGEYPDTLISVIDYRTPDPVCVEEIRDF